MYVGGVGRSSSVSPCELYNRLPRKPTHLPSVHQPPSLSSETCGESQFLFVQNVLFKENYRGSKANPRM